MLEDRLITPEAGSEEAVLELSLRPQTLSEYVGQERIKDNLHIVLSAAKVRGEPLEHVLLYGPPGLGKTTLAHIIAREMGVNIRVTSGPALERAGDLAAILTNLQPGDVLFIDEIHRLNKLIEEVMYPAMEDYALDIVLGKGPSARTVRLDLPKFTIIGATTRASLLSSPLRDRFGMMYQLGFYAPGELQKIIHRSASLLRVPLDEAAATRLAHCSRSTPRVANRLLKRVRDFAQVKGDGRVTEDICDRALELLAIDGEGLDQADRRILEVIIDKFQGGPVGLQTLAAASSEEMETIEDIYEPFLMQLGFLARTPRGRVATRRAYEHLGRTAPSSQAAQEMLL